MITHHSKYGTPFNRNIIVLMSMLLMSSACNRDVSNHTESPSSKEAAQTNSEDSHETHDRAVVILDTTALRLGGIVIATAETHTVTGIPVTGTLTYDANRVSHIGAHTPGRVVDLKADLGTRVTRGQVLALLESHEVGQIRAEKHEAEVLIRIAKENYAREARLSAQGITSRKELLNSEVELRRAEALLRSAEERLRLLDAGHRTGGQFAVVAPFSGVVVARNASRGEMTVPEINLFTIADLSRVWIEFDIFERDLARVRTGQPVTVTVAAYKKKMFSGRLVYLSDFIDTTRRTVRARIELPNPDRTLKPGMFAKGTIHVETNNQAAAVVPQEAVQRVGDRHVVFVPGSILGEFRAIPVELGETLDGNRVVIQVGLDPRSRIVTAGAFTLRAELQKGELKEGGH